MAKQGDGWLSRGMGGKERGWIAKKVGWVAKKGGWAAKLVACPLARMLREHSEFEFRHPSKIINGRHKQRSGQHVLARQKNIKKKLRAGDVQVVLELFFTENSYEIQRTG